MEAHAEKFGIDCPEIIDMYSVLNDIKDGKTEKYDNAQLYIDNAGLVLNRLLNEIGIKGKVVEISLSMDGIGNQYMETSAFITGVIAAWLFGVFCGIPIVYKILEKNK